MTLIELGFGIAACAVAALLAPVIGPHLGWSPRATDFAVVYSLAIFATVRATPQGLLQLAGRFDLIGAHQMISPLVRLIGSVIVWQAGGGLIGFLIVWLASALAEGASMWLLGLWALRRMRLDGRLLGSVEGVLDENAGLLPFVATTNLDLTLRDPRAADRAPDRRLAAGSGRRGRSRPGPARLLGAAAARHAARPGELCGAGAADRGGRHQRPAADGLARRRRGGRRWHSRRHSLRPVRRGDPAAARRP